MKPPGAVLTTINQSFITEISQGDPEIYLTLFLGVLDMEKLTFEFSSAGTHVPPLVLSAGIPTELFDQSDFPIGHVANHEYATERHKFASGDAFLFVSDGVIEARHGETMLRDGPSQGDGGAHPERDRARRGAGPWSNGVREFLQAAAAPGRHVPAVHHVRQTGRPSPMTGEGAGTHPSAWRSYTRPRYRDGRADRVLQSLQRAFSRRHHGLPHRRRLSACRGLPP